MQDMKILVNAAWAGLLVLRQARRVKAKDLHNGVPRLVQPEIRVEQLSLK
jgi:hypothetical protein